MTRAVTIAELGDQNVFTVDGNNNRIGIGTTNPQALLQVGTGVSVYGNSGIVSAKTYYGSGAELTGITGGATLSAASGSQRVVVTSLTSGSMTAAGTDADFAWNSTTNTLSATNINVSGTLTYEDVTNIDSVGIVTARSGLDVTGGNVTIGTGSTVGFGSTAYFPDGAKAAFGDDNDLQIHHTGTGSLIRQTGTGSLFITNAVDNKDVVIQSDDGSGGTSPYFRADGSNGEAVLYHYGSEILVTKSGGINVTGVVTATGSVQVGSGQSFGANGPTAVYYGDGSNLTGISAGGITTTKYSPTANAIIQIGLGTAQHHELTLTAGFTTITTSGGSMGESHSLVLIQPSSGIATVGFSTFFQFPSGAIPSMSEGSSKVDLISFVVKDVAGNTGTGATELLASAGLNYS